MNSRFNIIKHCVLNKLSIDIALKIILLKYGHVHSPANVNRYTNIYMKLQKKCAIQTSVNYIDLHNYELEDLDLTIEDII